MTRVQRTIRFGHLLSYHLMHAEKHIAVIGGGVAGLTAAYYLHGRLSYDKSEIYRCTVFELEDRPGGNCHSAYLDLPYQEPFGDLGVNDFNTERYKNFMGLLKQLEKEGFSVPHEPLIDTTCWYTPRGLSGGARVYTDDELINYERHPDKPWLANIARDWDRFQSTAQKVLTQARYARMSVDEFIAEEGYSYDFAEYNLRARINGMYYVNDSSPGSMPIRAVMSYYHLQEGIGEEKSTQVRRARASAFPRKPGNDASPRHYFVGGASHWIQQLTACLKRRGVQFRLGVFPVATLEVPARGQDYQDPQNATYDARWRVDATPRSAVPPRSSRMSNWTHVTEAPVRHFDHVISAVHADRVGRVIDEGLTSSMVTAVSYFDYYNAIGIVHDDASVLPEDKSAWCTYNILIYPPKTQMLRPYTISYVERKHHGEDSNLAPFVTLSPFSSIENEHIYGMVRLPSVERVLGVGYFRHNTLTWESLDAQENLHKEQGRNGLWFTGGWTNGAGLHEEVLAMSKEIALFIRRIPQAGGEGYRAGHLDVAPKHIRDSFEPDSDPYPDGFWD